jgi:hypothetical protein
MAMSATALAQQPPPKREIAPEYREAAEKRALEKQKLALCQQKAETEKILVRDRAAYIIACLDAK